MKYVYIVLVSFFLLNCQNSKTEKLTAEVLVNTSIEESGGEKIANSDIGFTFRNIQYRAKRSKGNFTLIRIQNIGNDRVLDSLTNDGYSRSVNSNIIKVPDSMVPRYSASINSVHYFSVLPYGLNDKAVNKELLAEISIKGQDYYTVKVTFDKDGGGEDFEDVFFYWINKHTSKVDYLAYSYNESDGKGMRFREAYNERIIEGIRFVDYNNYKPENASIVLTDLPQLFEAGNLKLLSKIELENVTVNL